MAVSRLYRIKLMVASASRVRLSCRPAKFHTIDRPNLSYPWQYAFLVANSFLMSSGVMLPGLASSCHCIHFWMSRAAASTSPFRALKKRRQVDSSNSACGYLRARCCSRANSRAVVCAFVRSAGGSLLAVASQRVADCVCRIHPCSACAVSHAGIRIKCATVDQVPCTAPPCKPVVDQASRPRELKRKGQVKILVTYGDEGLLLQDWSQSNMLLSQASTATVRSSKPPPQGSNLVFSVMAVAVTREGSDRPSRTQQHSKKPNISLRGVKW
mmetsp:Transcript_92493/g.232592  ORF Transcript_92493/g.232592 Transcript_92493/m.232592 type:complete len:270 (+) Transcript_92493:225-1034(+)